MSRLAVAPLRSKRSFLMAIFARSRFTLRKTSCRLNKCRGGPEQPSNSLGIEFLRFQDNDRERLQLFIRRLLLGSPALAPAGRAGAGGHPGGTAQPRFIPDPSSYNVPLQVFLTAVPNPSTSAIARQILPG